MRLNIMVNESAQRFPCQWIVPSALERNHLQATMSLVWANSKGNERESQCI